MSWSWKIFTAFGIPVRLHISMLIIPFIAFQRASADPTLTFIAALILSVALFASVLAHEFGHALTGRKFGVNTEDIILTPIGGMARMQYIPKNPKQEIAIAIAGPLVSFALAGIFFLLPLFVPLPTQGLQEVVFWTFLVNLVLGLFNLIPALPMDGGRVFRGLLSLKYGHLKATLIAAKVGRYIAIAGGLYGLSGILGPEGISWNLVIIAFFVHSFATQEERMAQRVAAYEAGQAQGMGPFGPMQGRGPGGFHVYTNRAAGTQDGWQQQTRHSDVKVVETGKVEVISRKDPKPH